MRIGPSAADVAGHQRLERRGRIGAGETQLAHMRNVEQPGLGAGVQMLGEDAGRILHRHLIAGERHHPGAERLVEIVERRALERRGVLGGHGVLGRHPGHLRQRADATASRYAPSVVDPERFTHTHPSRVAAGLLLR